MAYAVFGSCRGRSCHICEGRTKTIDHDRQLLCPRRPKSEAFHSMSINSGLGIKAKSRVILQGNNKNVTTLQSGKKLLDVPTRHIIRLENPRIMPTSPVLPAVDTASPAFDLWQTQPCRACLEVYSTYPLSEPLRVNHQRKPSRCHKVERGYVGSAMINANQTTRCLVKETKHRSWLRLVAVHGHPVRVPAQLAVGRRADGSAAVALCAALLQGQKLLGTERLVVDLRGGLNKILQVGAEEEVAQVDKLAMVLVLYVDDAPPVLTSSNLLAINDDVLLRADNGEGNEALLCVVSSGPWAVQEALYLALIWVLIPRSSSSSSSLS